MDDASKAARWLGWIPFEGIVDARASEPIIRRRAFGQPKAFVAGGLDVADLDIDGAS
jgi:hypothetical protein